MSAEYEINVDGRNYLLTSANGMEVRPHYRTAEQELRKVNEININRGLGIVTGSVKIENVTFIYREVTTDEEMQLWLATRRLTSFVNDIDQLPKNGIDAESFGKIFTAVRDGHMSPEEGVKQTNDLITQARNKQRLSEQQQFFNVAEQWAHKPDVTLREACHGVAYDAYRLANPSQPQVMVQQEYGNMFDHNFVNEIKARQIRSAKELFGGSS